MAWKKGPLPKDTFNYGGVQLQGSKGPGFFSACPSASCRQGPVDVHLAADARFAANLHNERVWSNQA